MKNMTMLVVMLCITSISAHSAGVVKLSAEKKAALKDIGMTEAAYLKHISDLAAQVAAEEEKKKAAAEQEKKVAEEKRKAALDILGMDEATAKAASSIAGASAPTSSTAEVPPTKADDGVIPPKDKEGWILLWDGRLGKAVWRKKENKKPDFDWSTLLSPTAGVADHFMVGLRLRTFNSLNASSQPAGFTMMSSDEGTVNAGLVIQAKAQVKDVSVALEFLPLDNVRDLNVKFYGSSLGKLTVHTRNVLIGKIFVLDKPSWSPKLSVSLGLGVEETQIEGVVSLGGWRAPTTGDGFSSVFQIGSNYQLNNRLNLGVDYERSNVRIVTSIPGVPDLVAVYTDRLSVRMMMGLF